MYGWTESYEESQQNLVCKEENNVHIHVMFMGQEYDDIFTKLTNTLIAILNVKNTFKIKFHNTFWYSVIEVK